jgi:hypothetical protein
MTYLSSLESILLKNYLPNPSFFVTTRVLYAILNIGLLAVFHNYSILYTCSPSLIRTSEFSLSSPHICHKMVLLTPRGAI